MSSEDLAHKYISPIQAQICRHAIQFSGSNQHDAQEFLSFLLDELHEDLNRVLLKPEPCAPTIERETELELLPPQVASAQEWALYQSRNDSVVVDYFQGQFKNRLQCFTCHKVSFIAEMSQSTPLLMDTDIDDLQYIHVSLLANTCHSWR